MFDRSEAKKRSGSHSCVAPVQRLSTPLHLTSKVLQEVITCEVLCRLSSLSSGDGSGAGAGRSSGRGACQGSAGASARRGCRRDAMYAAISRNTGRSRCARLRHRVRVSHQQVRCPLQTCNSCAPPNIIPSSGWSEVISEAQFFLITLHREHSKTPAHLFVRKL